MFFSRDGSDPPCQGQDSQTISLFQSQICHGSTFGLCTPATSCPAPTSLLIVLPGAVIGGEGDILIESLPLLPLCQAVTVPKSTMPMNF